MFRLFSFSFAAIIGGPYVGYSKYTAFPFNLDYLCPHLALSTVANTPVTIAETVSEPVTPITVASTPDTGKVETTQAPPAPQQPEIVPVLEPVSPPVTATVDASAPGASVESNSNAEECGGIDINLISLQTSGY